MQQTYTNEEIIHAFDSLPQVVKEAIVETPIPEIVRSIGEKYNLHADISGSIYNNINLITLGLKDRDLLRSELLSMQNFPKESIDDVMHDINTEIFNPLREAVISNRQIEEDVLSKDQQKVSPSEAPVAGVEYIEQKEIIDKDNNVVDIKTKEEEILKESGIEINNNIPKNTGSLSLKDIRMPDTPIKSPFVEPTLNKTPTETPQIKEPTQTVTKNLIEEKMSGSFGIKKETTDHSLPQVGSDRKQSISDLYREPIE